MTVRLVVLESMAGADVPYALTAIFCRRPGPALTGILFGCTLVIAMRRDRVSQHSVYHSFSQRGFMNPVFFDTVTGTTGTSRFPGEIRREGAARNFIWRLAVALSATAPAIADKFQVKPCDVPFQRSRIAGETIYQTKNELRSRIRPLRFCHRSTTRTWRAPATRIASPCSPPRRHASRP
jgi:hypothetical protein